MDVPLKRESAAFQVNRLIFVNQAAALREEGPCSSWEKTTRGTQLFILRPRVLPHPRGRCGTGPEIQSLCSNSANEDAPPNHSKGEEKRWEEAHSLQCDASQVLGSCLEWLSQGKTSEKLQQSVNIFWVCWKEIKSEDFVSTFFFLLFHNLLTFCTFLNIA